MGDALGSYPYGMYGGGMQGGQPSLQPSMRGYNAYGMGQGPISMQGPAGFSPQLLAAAFGHIMQQLQQQGLPQGLPQARGPMTPPAPGGAIADVYHQAGLPGGTGMQLPQPMGGQMAAVQQAGMQPPGTPPGWKDIPQVGPPIPGFGPQPAAPPQARPVAQPMTVRPGYGTTMPAGPQAAGNRSIGDLMARYPGLYSR